MNQLNQYLKAIQTTKVEYGRMIEDTDDPEKKRVYQLMIDDLETEEKRILRELNGQ